MQRDGIAHARKRLFTRSSSTNGLPMRPNGVGRPRGTSIAGFPWSLLALLAAAALGLTLAENTSAASSDGRIVYASARDGDTELYLADASGREVRRLTRNRASDYLPRFSPDGTKIVFVSDRDGDDEIYVMNADGTEVRQLTRNGSANGPLISDTTPAWSPDGRRIAFASNRDGGEHEIYVMNADGREQRRLTRTKQFVINIAPAFSPDGRRIAFASNRVSFFNLEIYTMRHGGTELRRLTRTPGDHDVLGDDNMPVHSPDGKRIVFSSNRDQQSEIYIMNTDGSGQTRLTKRLRSDEMLPRFSPDGKQILFESFRPGSRSDVVVMNADGGGVRRIVAGLNPDWVPDHALSVK